MPTPRASAPSKSAITIIRPPAFESIPWLRSGFSTRTGGVSEAYGGNSLNLGITADDTRTNVERNRGLFFDAIGVSERGKAGRGTGVPPVTTRLKSQPWPSVAMKQIHSSIIHEFKDWPQPQQPLSGDGLITRVPRVVLTVRIADCIPVLIVDPVERAIGAFHAGWRGTLSRIVEKGVGEMRRAFASDPAKLLAAIGPGIHRCCYQVSDDIKEKFASQFSYADNLFEDVFSSDPVHDKYPLLFMNQRAPGHGDPHCTLHLDLIAANRRQLIDAGVAEKNIWISGLCTSCRNDLLFSHRKEHGKTGRMMAAIAIAG